MTTKSLTTIIRRGWYFNSL